MHNRHISIYRFEPRWSDRVAWYGSAVAATALSWCIWWLSPVMHQDPFVIFILAVVFIARFFGFGPAVLCTFSSALVLDYFVFRSRLGIAFSQNELQPVRSSAGRSRFSSRRTDWKNSVTIWRA